jgi:hypothetical protein
VTDPTPRRPLNRHERRAQEAIAKRRLREWITETRAAVATHHRRAAKRAQP